MIDAFAAVPAELKFYSNAGHLTSATRMVPSIVAATNGRGATAALDGNESWRSAQNALHRAFRDVNAEDVRTPSTGDRDTFDATTCR